MGTDEDGRDAVDRIVAQWEHERPGMDLLPMEVFGRIHRISQLTSRRLAPIYTRYGVGITEFDVLAAIRRSGPPFALAPKEIAATLMLTSGGLTGRLDKLEAAGLVKRLPDPLDRRALRVRLTDKGREAIEEAADAGLVGQRELLDALPADEQRVLAGLLRKLHAGFEVDAID